MLAPPCLITAYKALDEGRHVVGIISRHDHMAVLSWTRLKITDGERRLLYHRDPAIRSRCSIGMLLDMDAVMRD